MGVFTLYEGGEPRRLPIEAKGPDPALTRMQEFQAFRLSACKEYGTLFGLGYVFIGFS